MNDHNRKIIAPVIITVVFLIILIGYGIAIMAAAETAPMLWLGVLPLALLGGGMVCVLIARIKEIRSGEEDDLNDY